MELFDPPSLGDIVIYYDEDRSPNAAIVALVHEGESRHISRPSLNLTICKPNAHVAPRMMVEPAYHDGDKWHLVNKWAYKGEVSE